MHNGSEDGCGNGSPYAPTPLILIFMLDKKEGQKPILLTFYIANLLSVA
jgi:hypothetical protein